MSIAWENNRTALETQEFSIDPLINQKIKSAVQGLQKSIQNYFIEFTTERDKESVADFLIACSQQENVAVKTRRVYLIALTYLSRFLENKKSFDTITSKELSVFLNSVFLNSMYKAETSILNFEFDEKVHPGVTITESEDIKFIWDEGDLTFLEVEGHLT